MAKPVERIATPTDLAMIRERIGSGATVDQEAAAVNRFIEDLTFRWIDFGGILVQQCRICHRLRDGDGHLASCLAKAVL